MGEIFCDACVWCVEHVVYLLAVRSICTGFAVHAMCLSRSVDQGWCSHERVGVPYVKLCMAHETAQLVQLVRIENGWNLHLHCNAGETKTQRRERVTVKKQFCWYCTCQPLVLCVVYLTLDYTLCKCMAYVNA